jgi:hypothetical protein
MVRRVREEIVGSISDWHRYRGSSDEERKIPPPDVEAQIMKATKERARHLIARDHARSPVSQYDWNNMQNTRRWALIAAAEAELDAQGWEGYPAFLRLDQVGAQNG